MTGKVELGTGVQPRCARSSPRNSTILSIINWIQGDTANTVDQAPTFGSQMIKRGGGQLRQAAAEPRRHCCPWRQYA